MFEIIYFSFLIFLHEHFIDVTGIDVVGLVQCTSPFVKVNHLEMAVEQMISGASSVFSVVRSHSLRWVEDDQQDGSNTHKLFSCLDRSENKMTYLPLCASEFFRRRDSRH